MISDDFYLDSSLVQGLIRVEFQYSNVTNFTYSRKQSIVRNSGKFLHLHHQMPIHSMASIVKRCIVT
jgi:hypothetical protein